MSVKKYSIFTIVTYLIVLFSPLLGPLVGVATSNQLIQLTTVMYFVGALLLLFYKAKSPAFTIEKQPKNLFFALFLGIAGIFLALMLQVILIQVEQLVFNQSVDSQNTDSIIQLIKQNAIFILATTIAGPMMEELVFRRAIFGALAERFGFVIPALISSLLFAFAHDDGHLLLYSGLGFFFCFLYRYTGRILTTMCTHVGMNLLVIIVQLGLQSS